MGAKPERTTFPGVFRRGSRFMVRWRDGAGAQRQRSARTFEEACNLKRAIRQGERPSERDLPLVAFDRRPAGWARRAERLERAAAIMRDPERRRRAPVPLLMRLDAAVRALEATVEPEPL